MMVITGRVGARRTPFQSTCEPSTSSNHSVRASWYKSLSRWFSRHFIASSSVSAVSSGTSLIRRPYTPTQHHRRQLICTVQNRMVGTCYGLRTSPIPGPPKTRKISEVLPPLSLIGRMKSSPRLLSVHRVVNTSIRLLAALPPLRTTRRLRVDITGYYGCWRMFGADKAFFAAAQEVSRRNKNAGEAWNERKKNRELER
jgi:hypothetical protein